MPFGIKTAGSIFVRALNEVFDAEFSKFLTFYVDDMVVSSKNVDDHIKHLMIILTRMREVGLTLRLDKILFAREEIPFLGFILSTKGVRPDPEKIRAILEIPEPRTRLELQSFIGV